MTRTASIACPCGGKSLVIDSRGQRGKRRRRYECQTCAECFSTVEITAVEYDNLQAMKINIVAIGEAIRALEKVRNAVRDSR